MPHHNTKNVENMSFSEEVTARHGGETLTSCYQCGTCASSCPVARLDSSFNPREIIKLSLLGEKEEVLSGDAIWLCCSCFNCQERCPQNVEIADLIYALRNIALEAGHSPRRLSLLKDELFRFPSSWKRNEQTMVYRPLNRWA